ncbi:MAG: TonB-dependent receptor [Acidobacteria bacterium]|nr:MAG: TonB-dependent receptor [Acidobacteriota bacterium]
MCALLMVVVGSALAQSPNATVNGEVVDPSGAAIADATVEVINEATNLKYSTKTNREGIYVIPELPPATYRIEVSHVGFKTVLKPDVIFNVRDAVAINFKLPIGAISETVTVEAGASMINTTDASVSTVVDQTYVKNMPLNGRSFQDLILLTPGVTALSPTHAGGRGLGTSGEFSINGQRTEANNYTVDGVSANVGVGSSPSGGLASGGPSGSVPAATALGTTQSLVSVDDLQELRVNTSTYSAEYGRNPGGQLAFETKSGTNQWHGTAYDYLRNGFFDANDWFNNYLGVKKLPVPQNDFGGALGEPVRIPGLYNGKDKTFFFASYEGLRLSQPQPASTSPVPDLCMRGSGPCPSYVNSSGMTVQRTPAASALLPVVNAFPLPSPGGLEDPVNGVGQFIGAWSNPSSLNSTSVRFDHTVNDKLRLFFRFSDTASSATNLEVEAGVKSDAAFSARTYTAGLTNIFSTRWTNDFRLNYSSNEATTLFSSIAFGGSTPVNLPQLTGLGPQSWPQVVFLLGNNAFFFDQEPSSVAQRQWNLVDTVGFSLGTHRFKFGVDYRRLTPLALRPTPNATYVYFDETSIETNNTNTGSGLIAIQTSAPAYPLYTNFSAFAQDQWKVSQRLSMSMGLRWEVNPAPSVTQGLMPYTIQGTDPSNWALAPQGTPLWQTTWFNFAPRLGAAYAVHDAPGWETVVRGGGGVFFDNGQQDGSIGFGGPGFTATLSPASPISPFPGNPATQIPTIVNPPVGKQSTIFGFPSHLQLPYTLQWNVSIEQALGRSQALTVSYVGAHGDRLLQLNAFRNSTNPNARTFQMAQNGLTSDYDSLQVQFRRRLSKGLTALGSYTWSHCIDYGSENFYITPRRGNCDFDARHNLSAAFSYDVPNMGQNEFAKAVLNHWGVDDRFVARTAFPVSLQGNLIFDPVTKQQMESGENLVSGQPIYLYGANCTSVLQVLGDLAPGKTCPGGRAVNPCALVAVGGSVNHGCPANPTIVGLLPRGFVRGFDAVQMNLAIRREFPIHEGLRLQFRAEAFNMFNHPNFGRISTSGTQFGQGTATLANSLGVLSPLYQTGGPRSMQFALKFVF